VNEPNRPRISEIAEFSGKIDRPHVLLGVAMA
jgi:hypothetical protein